MPDKAKRLTPKPETLRELFLKSSNQCACPGSSRLMMEQDGIFFAQICHTEQRSPEEVEEDRLNGNADAS